MCSLYDAWQFIWPDLQVIFIYTTICCVSAFEYSTRANHRRHAVRRRIASSAEIYGWTVTESLQRNHGKYFMNAISREIISRIGKIR